jgi:hypothetical protein
VFRRIVIIIEGMKTFYCIADHAIAIGKDPLS